MPKSNQTNSLKPGFSTGGSFQALAVQSIESDSESDSQTTPNIPSHRTPSTAISTSTKKGRAKQRARDRARKSAGTSTLSDPTEFRNNPSLDRIIHSFDLTRRPRNHQNRFHCF
ncbi:uncharacterized protein MELLADRAFT_56427 [Melampsora larici-populina 98AG31]|uniref:Uncharacterized protein n=1 Tax=Melampsora larici-populina (strain 98AG31 / pathotype 3-4-7) TaxID=747676 RepID=F4RQE1_MELLP|nr:uncharacterized protein MELLADRAFT_56427 [Melampsora larici-populina 98AG31]EGG05392.1 hypothetical protein MELLADRAFT_56427 [Melampsora larici-populina 98AG31]